MRRAWAIGIAILVASGSSLTGVAQSGRIREPKTAPAVTAPPDANPAGAAAPGKAGPPADPTPKPIPAGGSVVAQSVDGAIVRTVLANGTVLVVRENPVTSVASIVTAVRLPAGVTSQRGIEIGRQAARSGTESAASRIAALGGMIDVSADADFLFFATNVLGREGEAVLAAHATLFAAPEGRTGPLILDPAHTTVVASGRVNAYTSLSTVQREFGAIQIAAPEVAPPTGGKRSGTRPPTPAVVAPPPAAVAIAPTARYTLESGAAGPATISIAFDAPPGPSVDGAVVDVLAAALGTGRTSRLGLAFTDSPFPVDASARAVWNGANRSLSASLSVDASRIDDASAIVWREIDLLRRERLSAAELQRARNQAELSEILRRCRPDEDAADLARLELGLRDVKAHSNRQARIRSVTPADVQAAAARLFALAAATVVESVPTGAPARPSTIEGYAARATTWAPGLARPVAPSDIRERAPMPAASEGEERSHSGERADSVLAPLPLPARDFSTLNGPKAFVREDASQPVVAIGFFFPSGRSAELPANRGVTELTLRTMLRGSKQFPGNALLFGIERLGGRVHIVNEPDLFGFVVEMLSRNADFVVPIAIDLVEHPQFETVAISRERDRLLFDQRPSRVPATVAAANLFWQGRYPTHAYGYAAEGMPDTIAKQNEETIRSWYATSIQALYPLVGIVGDTDGSSLVSRFVIDGFDRPEGERLGSPAVPPPSPVTEVAAVIPAATTTVAIGSVTPAGNWDALEAIEIAMRAVQVRVAALREAEAVSSISCGLERRRQAGAALCTVVSTADSESTIRAAVLAELTRVASAAWSVDEIVAGRRAATVAWTLSTARCTDMAVAYVRVTAFGLPLDTVERYGERLEALPADGVRRAAAAVLESGRIGRGVVRGVPGR